MAVPLVGKRARTVPASVFFLLTLFLNSTILLADSFALRHHPHLFGRKQQSRLAVNMKTPMMDGLSDDLDVADSGFTFAGTSVEKRPNSESRSLAGPFLVDCRKTTGSSSTETVYEWILTPLQDIPLDRTAYSSEGGQAWAALMLTDQSHELVNKHTSLRATVNDTKRSCHVEWSLSADSRVNAKSHIDDKLMPVLARILCQWAILESKVDGDTSIDDDGSSSSNWTIILPDSREPTTITISTTVPIQAAATRLFEHDASSEMVEMVNQKGQLLGCVPRKLVHALNLLHRGIGMFVTKNVPIIILDDDNNNNNQKHDSTFPDLYVHRRTDTKRIFPSLYDMFVGGVSTAGEDPRVTASREVAEELGLSLRDTSGDRLSKEPLLQCVVCTAYNRCVVDLFAYCMDTSKEQVQWQEEEVAWGSFVPYSIVEAAADRSILRLAERKEWPGRMPPIQSPAHGQGDETVAYNGAMPWPEWDFVPDGLLVWEAWLRKLHSDEAV